MARCLILVCGVLLSLATLPGCSSFPRDFREATLKPIPVQSIDGPWEGEWISTGGHRGRLRCLLALKACDANMNFGIRPVYEARFEAKFAGIFTAHYTTLLLIQSTGEVTTLSGDHDLGGLGGGLYHYEAKVTANTFEATYRSEADRGTFHMVRPVK